MRYNWRTIWQSLTEPSKEITEVGARRQARLLSSLLLILVLGSIQGTIRVYFSSPTLSPLLGLLGIGLLISYHLSRKADYIRGATLSVALMSLMAFVLAILRGDFSSTGFQAQFMWIILPIILASLYLSKRELIILVGSITIGLLLLPFIIPALTLLSLSSTISFFIISSLLIIIITDQRNQVEQERLALQALQTTKLSKAYQEFEVLLFAISHDLREPLHAIGGFSDMLEIRYKEKLDQRGRDYVHRIKRATNRLRQLLADMQQLYEIRLGVELTTQATEGEKIVQLALERLASQIKTSEANIQLATSWPIFEVNPKWASQAVYELVNNALKYTVNDQAPEIEIALYDGPEGQGICVRDRGPGVPEKYAEKIWILFRRTVGREVAGTGAGLAIVRQIAERHHGHAWVEARNGGGSEFVITFRSSKNNSS
jgi:signal transduction histidine kinase